MLCGRFDERRTPQDGIQGMSVPPEAGERAKGEMLHPVAGLKKFTLSPFWAVFK